MPTSDTAPGRHAPSNDDETAFRAALAAASAWPAARRRRLDQLAGARRVLVYSYGKRGKELALQLRALGVACVVFDNAPAQRARAQADGFETAPRLPRDLPVIVAAGQNQLEILPTAGPGAVGLHEALYAFDLRNSFGQARAFTDGLAGMTDALYRLHRRLDADSRQAFLDLLLFRASLYVSHIAATRRPMGEMWAPPVVCRSHIRSFCDVGAYDGDTLASIKGWCPRLERTFTIEPNGELAAPIARIAEAEGLSNTAYVGAAWSRRARLRVERICDDMFSVTEAEDGSVEADALDALVGETVYDYVKFDVESTEASALAGAGRTLRASRCLSVAAYHLPGDIVAVPEQLQAILQGDDRWRFAFSHFSQSFEDSIVYAYRPAD